ncbi:MAG: hypothetical protein AAF191_15830, partial [Verrucomicrobiota bacterium]
ESSKALIPEGRTQIGEWGWTGEDGARQWTYVPPRAEYSFFRTTPFIRRGDPLKKSIGGFSPASRAEMEKVNPQTKGGKPDLSPDYYQPREERIPSQIAKVITSNNSIVASKWTYALNEAVQANLPDPWRNYQLVSTQWPSDSGLTSDWETYLKDYNAFVRTNPTKGLKPLGGLGGGTVRAGNPAPVSLGNAAAETYMQINGSCMNCHAGATFGGTTGDDAFADFSFMLQRAH